MKKTPSVSCASFRRAPFARLVCLAPRSPSRRTAPLAPSDTPRSQPSPPRPPRAIAPSSLRSRSRPRVSRQSSRSSIDPRRPSFNRTVIHSFIHSRTRASPSSRTFPRRAHDGLRLLLRDHELGDPIRARRVHDRPLERSPSPSPVSSLESRGRRRPDPRGFPFLHETVRDDGVRTPSNARAREEGGGVSTHTRTHRRITIRKQPPPSHPRCLTSIAGRPSLGARARRPRRHSTTTKMFASTTSATTTMFASGGSVSAKFRATAAPARAPTRVVIESA